MLDDASDKCWSRFVKKKSDLPKTVVSFIKGLKNTFGIQVKSIRLDNSGENLALQELCEQEGLGIKFEFTAPNTPQQNGRVERKYQTLYGRMRCMLAGSGIEGSLKSALWCEAASTATDLDGFYIAPGSKKCAFDKFYQGKKKGIVDVPRIFGEMAMVETVKK